MINYTYRLYFANWVFRSEKYFGTEQEAEKDIAAFKKWSNIRSGEFEIIKCEHFCTNCED